MLLVLILFVAGAIVMWFAHTPYAVYPATVALSTGLQVLMTRLPVASVRVVSLTMTL